jgi:hypothetical protein
MEEDPGAGIPMVLARVNIVSGAIGISLIIKKLKLRI